MMMNVFKPITGGLRTWMAGIIKTLSKKKGCLLLSLTA